MVTRDDLTRHVRDALRNLYDPIHLQRHPLVALLGLGPSPGETAGEALRKLLRETIDMLRPAPSVPASRPEWLGYRLLQLHYVRALSQTDVSEELGISEASFYRYQREAIEAVVSILWERRQLGSLKETAGAGPPADAPASKVREEAERLAAETPTQLVDMAGLLAGVRETIGPLAELQAVDLSWDLPPSLPAVYGHPPVLRQVFLGLLAEGVRICAGRSLSMRVAVQGDNILCQIRGQTDSPNQSGTKQGASLATSQELLSMYQGQLWSQGDSSGDLYLAFTLPISKPKTILVVDDDPGAVGLYRRTLERDQHILLEARSVEQAEARLTLDRPDLVLLDVMMPDQDGWAFLQRLKSNPATRDIPTIICSVVEQPRLAQALGAAEVLTKPIKPEELLQTVRKCLDLASRRG